MSLLVWNCRGAGKPMTVREFTKKFAPSVLCVAETQLEGMRVENLASTIGFESSFAVSNTGRSGGLGIF